MFNNLLNDILRWSIARRWLVLISSVLISLLGVINVLQMPLDVFPPFAPPQAVSYTHLRAHETRGNRVWPLWR